MDIQEPKTIPQSFVQDAGQYGTEHHIESATWLSSVWTWIKYQIFYVITNWSAASKAEKIFKEIQAETFNADYFCHASQAVLESFKNKCIDPEAHVVRDCLAKCIEQLYIAWNRARNETTQKGIENIGTALWDMQNPLPILPSLSHKSSEKAFPIIVEEEKEEQPMVDKSSSSSESEETSDVDKTPVVTEAPKKTKKQKTKSVLQRVSEKLLRKKSLDQQILHQEEKIESLNTALTEAQEDIPNKDQLVKTAQEEFEAASKIREEAPKRTRALNKTVSDAKKKLERAKKELKLAQEIPGRIEKTLEKETKKIETLHAQKEKEIEKPAQLKTETSEDVDVDLFAE